MSATSRMRVYVPTTLTALRRGRDLGVLGEASAPAHAVTPAVREWYVTGDLEELEYAVMLEAAERSLWLLAAEPDAPPRRVVVAADVLAAEVDPGGPARSSVRLASGVPMTAVVSVHVDEPEAEPAVASAVAALPAAEAGDEDARFEVEQAEGHELLWYDVTELGTL